MKESKTMQEVRNIKDELSLEYSQMTKQEQRDRANNIAQNFLARARNTGKAIEKTHIGYKITT